MDCNSPCLIYEGVQIMKSRPDNALDRVLRVETLISKPGFVMHQESVCLLYHLAEELN